MEWTWSRHQPCGWHAPCGNPAQTDPSYPNSDGSIGVWGYDSERNRLVKPSTRDLISYCGPQWINDYHSDKALRFRLEDEGELEEYVLPAMKWSYFVGQSEGKAKVDSDWF